MGTQEMLTKVKKLEALAREIIKKAGCPDPVEVKRYEFPKAKSFLGKVVLGPSPTLRISTYLMECSDRLITETIIHELVHLIPECRRDGHGPIWKRNANKINRMFPEYKITRLSYRSEFTKAARGVEKVPLGQKPIVSLEDKKKLSELMGSDPYAYYCPLCKKVIATYSRCPKHFLPTSGSRMCSIHRVSHGDNSLVILVRREYAHTRVFTKDRKVVII